MTDIKIYNQRINLKDVNEIYKTKEKSCMKKLRDNYKGKCYKGAYIIDILSLLEISNVEISRNHTDARALMDVRFEAQVIQRTENDLIAKCKIFKRKGNKIFAKTDYSDVILLQHEILKIVQDNDIIPIIVIKSRYTVLKDRLSIFAVPFVPYVPVKNYIYVMENSLNNDEIKKLKSYNLQLNELKDWIKKLNSTDKKKFTAFDNLFYPFKKQKKPQLLENKNISLLDLSTINLNAFKSGILIPSPEIINSKLFILNSEISNLSSIKSMIEKNENKKMIVKYIVIHEKSYIVFELLYIKFIKYLIFIKDMVKEYNYPKEDNIYWKNLKEYSI